MLRKGDTLTVTIALENDTQLRVNVFPRLFTLDGSRGNDRKALNTPLSLVATPDEFDSPAFIETLARFAGSVTGTRNTLEEVIAAHNTAAEEARKKVPATAHVRHSSKSDVGKPEKKKEEPAPVRHSSKSDGGTAEEATPSLI